LVCTRINEFQSIIIGVDKMTKVERSIVIEATLEEIEVVHNDLDRLHEWYAGIDKVKWDGGVYPKPGGKVNLT